MKENDGRKSSLTFEKFSSASRLLLVHVFTFSTTVPGKKDRDKKKGRTRIDVIEMPVIFRVLEEVPFHGINIKIQYRGIKTAR